MSRNSSIGWTVHTWSPRWGCIKVSPACDNCYAADIAHRFGKSFFCHAVPCGARGYFDDETWEKPRLWNAAARRRNGRHRAFCGSMCDVLEGTREQRPHLERLFGMIEETPSLIWMLLTKRPNNICKLAPYRREWRANLWVGTTIENQKWADERLPHLLNADSVVRFVSIEPMLGAVDLRPHLGSGLGQVNWLIVGGESEFKARGPACAVSWYRDTRDQCVEAGVPFVFKQWGNFVQEGDKLIKLRAKNKEAALDGALWHQHRALEVQP